MQSSPYYLNTWFLKAWYLGVWYLDSFCIWIVTVFGSSLYLDRHCIFFSFLVGSSNSNNQMSSSSTLPRSILSFQPMLPKDPKQTKALKQTLLPNVLNQTNVMSLSPANIAPSVPKSQFNFQLKPLQKTGKNIILHKCSPLNPGAYRWWDEVSFT